MDNYQWEAEDGTGQVVTKGPGDDGGLAGFVRFSLIPRSGLPLPRHDIIGTPMLRRFRRVFSKTRFNVREELPGKVFWEHGAVIQKTTEDLQAHVCPGDYVGKGVAGEDWYIVRAVHVDHLELAAPYAGKSKPKGLWCRKIARCFTEPENHLLHCVELADGRRIWVRDSSGAVLITGPDQDVYI